MVMGSCLGVVIKITLHEEIMEISTRGTQKKICCFIWLRPPRPPGFPKGNKSRVSVSTNAKHAARTVSIVPEAKKFRYHDCGRVDRQGRNANVCALKAGDSLHYLIRDTSVIDQ